MEFWKSKKFWFAVVGVFVPIVNSALGLEMATETVMTIVGPIMAYIVGQGIADVKK